MSSSFSLRRLRRRLRLCLPALLLVTGALIPIAPAAIARGNGLAEAVAALQAREFVIQWDHPRCRETNLYGLHIRGRRLVVVCPRGDRRDTLLHEAWHAVQAQCLRGQPLLAEDALLRSLGRGDRRELQLLYRPDQWQREAEARVMARQRLDRYLQALDQACGSPAAAPAAAAAAESI